MAIKQSSSGSAGTAAGGGGAGKAAGAASGRTAARAAARAAASQLAESDSEGGGGSSDFDLEVSVMCFFVGPCMCCCGGLHDVFRDFLSSLLVSKRQFLLAILFLLPIVPACACLFLPAGPQQ
jgi:hypothetical protein